MLESLRDITYVCYNQSMELQPWQQKSLRDLLEHLERMQEELRGKNGKWGKYEKLMSVNKKLMKITLIKAKMPQVKFPIKMTRVLLNGAVFYC